MKNIFKFLLCISIGLLLYTNAFAEDVTISATLVYPEQSVIDFAKSKGWTETIKQFNAESERVEYIENPTDYKTFTAQAVKDHLIRWATESKERQIDSAANATAETQKEQVRSIVSQALSVNVN